MGLKFKDFTRQRVATSFWAGDTFAPLEDTAQEASAWIDEHGIQVINVETVVLPLSQFSGGQVDPDATPKAGGRFNAEWHQFIRVWYRD